MTDAATGAARPGGLHSRPRPRSADLKLFIDRLFDHFDVRAAAAGTAWSVAQLYMKRRLDPKFATQWELAVQAHQERAEAAARQRVIDGDERPVFYHGARVGTVIDHNARLAALVLTHLRRPAAAPPAAPAAPDLPALTERLGTARAEGYLDALTDVRHGRLPDVIAQAQAAMTMRETADDRAAAQPAHAAAPGVDLAVAAADRARGGAAGQPPCEHRRRDRPAERAAAPGAAAAAGRLDDLGDAGGARLWQDICRGGVDPAAGGGEQHTDRAGRLQPGCGAGGDGSG